MMKTLLATLLLISGLSINSLHAQDFEKDNTSTELQLSLYPQPASSQLNLLFSTNQLHAPRVMIYDLLGNLIADAVAERQENGSYTVFLGDKKPGYYFLKIQSDTESFSRRITVKP